MVSDPFEERQSAILTQSERDYLVNGAPGLTDESKRKKEYRIRKRIQNAILDFILLIDGKGYQLTREALSDVREPNAAPEVMDDPGLLEGLYALEFALMRSLYDDDVGADDFPFLAGTALYRHIASEGPAEVLRQLEYAENGQFVEIQNKFVFDVLGEADVDDLEERLEEGTLLSFQALEFLVTYRDYDVSDVRGYLDALPVDYERLMWALEANPGRSALTHPDDIDTDEVIAEADSGFFDVPPEEYFREVQVPQWLSQFEEA